MNSFKSVRRAGECGDREATVVALLGRMATGLMGDELVSVVVDSLLAFRDVMFEWNPALL